MCDFLNSSEQLESVKELFQDKNISATDFDLKEIFVALEWNAKVDALRAWATSEKGVDPKAFDKAHHRWRILERLGGNPRNTREFVNLFCTRHSVKFSFDGRLTARDLGREPDIGSLADSLYLTGQELALPADMRKKEAISAALTEFNSNQKDAQLTAAQAAIIAPNAPAADDEWHKLAAAIADPSKQSHGYTIRALQTTIWQIKRKLVNDPKLPLEHHLMSVLTGPQGSGKTTFWNQFFTPLTGFIYPANFDELHDSANHDLWRHPVVLFDEMANAQRADMNIVKKAITADFFKSRMHYLHTSSYIRNAATMVGATNSTLGRIMFDTTGLRRFAPIQTLHGPSAAGDVAKVDWQALNSVNMLSLWHSVDHTAAHPLQSDPAAKAEWLNLDRSRTGNRHRGKLRKGL